VSPRDPGLQPERTALAWRRTALSVLVLALAALARSAQTHQPVEIALAVVGAGVAAVAAAVVVPRSARRDSRGPITSAWPRLVAVVSATLVLATAGAAAAILSADAVHP